MARYASVQGKRPPLPIRIVLTALSVGIVLLAVLSSGALASR